jgi:hypothetical protein
MSGRLVISYGSGRFGVFDRDAAGGQSALGTFDSLAAACAAHPEAVPDSGAWTASREQSPRSADRIASSSANARIAVWVGGATLALALVLDVIGERQRDPIGGFLTNTSFEFWLASVGVLAAGGIAGLILAIRSRGPARAWALVLASLAVGYAPLQIAFMALLAFGQGMAVG